MNDKDIYVMLEVNYLKELNKSIDDNNDDLFPFNWHRITNYKLKSEILFDAIKNKVKIIDTKKYKDTYGSLMDN